MILAFVPPVAAAGASLVGSEVGWAAVVSAGSAGAYCFLHLVKHCRSESSTEAQLNPAQPIRNMTHATLVLVCLAMLLVVSVAPSAGWALSAARAMIAGSSAVLVASGARQVYISSKILTVQRMMSTYDSVLTSADESLALHATIWEEAEAARKTLGTEAWQAERIHFLETQKAELTTELLRLVEINGDRPSEERLVGDEEHTSESQSQELAQQIVMYEQQAAELRSVRSNQMALADEVDGLLEVKDQQSKVRADSES